MLDQIKIFKHYDHIINSLLMYILTATIFFDYLPNALIENVFFQVITHFSLAQPFVLLGHTQRCPWDFFAVMDIAGLLQTM